MASFSAADAAFTGFRMVKRHPKTILAWIGLYFAFTIVMVVAMTVTVGPALADLQAGALSGATPDPARLAGSFSRLAPLYAVAFPVSLAIYAMSFAAVNRLVLRPEEGGFVHIRLGSAEFNQVIVLIVTGVCLVAAYLIGLLLMMVIVGASGFLFASMVRSAPAVGAIGGGIGFMFGLVCLFAPLVYVGVRVSLASAMTLDIGAPAFRRAWRLTRGHFWRMFGAYFILWVMLFVGLLVLAIVGGALAIAAIAGEPGFNITRFAAVFSPPASLAALLASPATWINYLLLSAFYVFGFVVTLGCSAEIYRNLSAASPDKVAETF
jgi:hypothetical protein